MEVNSNNSTYVVYVILLFIHSQSIQASRIDKFI